MKKLFAILLAVSLLLCSAALAEVTTTTALRPFVLGSVCRYHTVEYYDNVYARNHDVIGLQPFHSDVPAEYFVEDGEGNLALAPIVLDVTEEMRERLYGADTGEVVMYYGQYCDKRMDYRRRHTGFSGIHEGIDFRAGKGVQLHAILDGVVTRAGDSYGTVAVYNEQYDITVLYLHCRSIQVRRGMEITAGTLIAKEGKQRAGEYYTHVEVRKGHHTSANRYRNLKLQSDCPYGLLQEAMGVTESGRQPVTQAAVNQAQQMREEAEAEARRQAEAAAAEAAAAQAAAEEEALGIVEEETEANSEYSFSEESAEPTATPVPEATLPPTV